MYGNVNGVYDPVGYYINEYRADNPHPGTTVKGAQNNDSYRLFVYASQQGNNGRIYPQKGTENNITFDWDTAKNKKFKGEFSPTRGIKENDIVYLGGQLLTALTNPAAGTFNSINWTSSR